MTPIPVNQIHTNKLNWNKNPTQTGNEILRVNETTQDYERTGNRICWFCHEANAIE